MLGNSLAERRWSRDALRTVALVDRRAGGAAWTGATRDFAVRAGAAEIGSESFRVDAVATAPLPAGGLRLTMRLVGSGAAAGLTGTRTAEAYPGVAGFRTQTTLASATPLVLNGATLEQAGVGSVTPAIHAFRAGADWRETEWAGPPLAFGDPHAGDWRDTRTAAAGQPLEGAAQWIDAARGARRLFMVMERNDLPSSFAAYDGSTASLRLEYSRDVISAGPFEEMVHVENPNPDGGRTRTMRPGEPFALEAAFTGLGTSADDAAWQWSKYLMRNRLDPPYPHAVVFNSDKNDRNARSTGAKDDTDIAAVRALAPIARRLGVETFVLDDGWQARSGDWCPDSPQCPEPRPGFGPRFPDPTFDAVREAIAPMRLGLWMSPLHFHPSAATWQQHPDWVCQPLGTGLLAYNAADPGSSSNEAGIAEWSTAAFAHVESRIREAIERWGVRYFKFDFMAWIDCAGQNDLYEQHDAFVAMLDRVRRDHPSVTLEIDETNDYRLFPFESVVRGPSWFQNGTPETRQLVHNLWSLSPYVPGFSLGQHLLGGDSWKRESVDTLMVAALGSHVTLWTDLRTLPDPVVDRAALWLAFYKRFRDELSQMTYPLLDDPLRGGWTALQAWDPEAARGAMLAFRQGSDDATRRIALRNVPPDLRFDLLEGPTGERFDRVSSADLSRGIDVTVPARGGARAIVVVPAPGERPPGAPEERAGAQGGAGAANPLGLPPSAGCVDRRRFSFGLHHPRRTRIVRVDVYVNGKRKLRRRGRSIERVALRRLPKGRFTVRIEALHSNGAEVISTRRYSGCRQGKPKTRRRGPRR
ncbi:MAG TPA: alpha-galactosidase [Thermoleophilaceae bacterium]